MQVAEALNDDEILELDADKVFLVTETFSNVDMYLESDSKHGFIELNAPGLYNFQLPEPGSLHDVNTQNENDSQSMQLGSWIQEPIEEINLIKAEDKELLGELQRDEITGEFFIMLPLEMNVLVKPDPSHNIEQIKDSLLNLATTDSVKLLKKRDNEEDNESQTTLTDTPKENENHFEEALEVCRFVVPKMSLNFKLTLTIGDLNNADEQPNEELELKD